MAASGFPVLGFLAAGFFATGFLAATGASAASGLASTAAGLVAAHTTHNSDSREAGCCGTSSRRQQKASLSPDRLEGHTMQPSSSVGELSNLPGPQTAQFMAALLHD